MSASEVPLCFGARHFSRLEFDAGVVLRWESSNGNFIPLRPADAWATMCRAHWQQDRLRSAFMALTTSTVFVNAVEIRQGGIYINDASGVTTVAIMVLP